MQRAGMGRSPWAVAVARLVPVALVVAVAGAGGAATATAAAGPAAPAPASLDPGAAAVVARYRERIPELMASEGVPGLAIALVDGDTVLWTEGFGSTARDGGRPVTADTMFSVQSVSKVFTATAVMQAVGDGLLELDEPITTYLPEFTVHSAFEDHPERRITLRMLLSHTAGFTHEAPVGNNVDVDPGTWEAHVASISDTWLRFPVGSGYAYSNLGIDLAGHVLERVAARPFPAVVRESLLSPLGMDRSTFDPAEIRSAHDRATGHLAPLPSLPLDVPMVPAGGIYTSARDLARFLGFLLGDGTVDGRTVLAPELMAEMRTVPAPFAGEASGYALGVGVTRWRAGRYLDLYSHTGGGFGFLADLWWVPQVQLGVAVLTNDGGHDLQGELALSVLRDLVNEPGAYHDRFLAQPIQEDVGDRGRFEPPLAMPRLVAAAAMPPTPDDRERWRRYEGAFRAPMLGFIDPRPPADRFTVASSGPVFESHETGAAVRHRLVEVEPGLFLADNGEMLDLRTDRPTWRSIRLVRVPDGPAPWSWGVLAGAALVAVGWVAGAVLAAVRRRRQPSAATAAAQAPGPGASVAWRRVAALLGTVVAVLVLAVGAAIAAMPSVVDAGFLGGLEVPVLVRVALHLPLALVAAAVALAAVVGVGWWRGWWSPGRGRRLAALTVAAVAVALQLTAWHLVGWAPA